MSYSFWPEFGFLMIGGVVGAAALIPYSFKLIKSSARKKPLKVAPKVLALLSFLQNAVLAAITVGVGLFVAHKIGLGAPDIAAFVTSNSAPNNAVHIVLYPLVAGLVIGFLMAIIDLTVYLKRWPKPILDSAKNTTLLENFAASFYGGFNEEYLSRLLGVSVVAWLFSRVWHASNGEPTSAVFWAAIIIMAVLFAVGHLPALKGLVGKVSSAMLSRTLLLNIPVGLACGWFYWKFGIEAAIITHFASDVIYHVGGTVVLRSHLRS